MEKTKNRNFESAAAIAAPSAPQKFSWEKLRQKCEKASDHWIYGVVSLLLTFYILLINDIRRLVFDPNVDDPIFISMFVVMGLFALEIVFFSLVKSHYFLHFFFWIDVLSTLTILLDIDWVLNFLIAGSTIKVTSYTSILRATRTSRIGGRIGRMMRAVRIIGLLKAVNSEKAAAKRKLKAALSIENGGDVAKESLMAKASAAPSLWSAVPSARPILRSEATRRSAKGRSLAESELERHTIPSNFQSAPSDFPLSLPRTLIAVSAKPPKAESFVDSTVESEENLTTEKIQNDVFEETNVGRSLMDSTSKRVAVIVLVLMLSVPLFSLETYISPYSKYQFGVDQIYATMLAEPRIGSAQRAQWESYVQMLDADSLSIISFELFWLNATGNANLVNSFYNATNAGAMRASEIAIFAANGGFAQNAFNLTAKIDYRASQRIDAALSIAKTLFLCVVFSLAAFLFAQETTDLVLKPIEDMLRKISNIADNPVNAAVVGEEEAYLCERVRGRGGAAAAEEATETTALVGVIAKIGALLAVGFGEAGAEVIVENLRRGERIDPMVPGRKVLAVFGFCDVRSFTDATEILQENVMLFVNDVAELVHSRVDRYGGKPNKNVGDAFLLVWKIDNNCDEAERALADPTSERGARVAARQRACAELALLAFAQILIEINRSTALVRYNDHAELRARIRNFRVRLGFGLHLGWAIEGAIGSRYKIDASYLSPHVNMAARLEAATKQFGVPLLITDRLVRALSPPIAAYLRCIDVVAMSGWDAPLELYTLDGDFEALSASKAAPKPKLSDIERKSQKYMQRLSTKMFVDSVFEGRASVAELLAHDRQLRAARERFTPTFFRVWRAALDAYIAGNWPAALGALAECARLVPEDGPARCLAATINANKGKAPGDWNGVRKLIE